MITVEVANVPAEFQYLRKNPHQCSNGEDGKWEIRHVIAHKTYDICEAVCANCKTKESFKFNLDQSY